MSRSTPGLLKAPYSLPPEPGDVSVQGPGEARRAQEERSARARTFCAKPLADAARGGAAVDCLIATGGARGVHGQRTLKDQQGSRWGRGLGLHGGPDKVVHGDRRTSSWDRECGGARYLRRYCT